MILGIIVHDSPFPYYFDQTKKRKKHESCKRENGIPFPFQKKYLLK